MVKKAKSAPRKKADPAPKKAKGAKAAAKSAPKASRPGAGKAGAKKSQAPAKAAKTIVKSVAKLSGKLSKASARVAAKVTEKVKAVEKAAVRVAVKAAGKAGGAATVAPKGKPAAKPAAIRPEAPGGKAKAAEGPVRSGSGAKVRGEAPKESAAKGAPAPENPADSGPEIKRPAKPFFLEVKAGVERVIKRGDKSAASPVIDLQARRKGPAAEETSEELAERIERELQSQSFLKRAPMRPQMCTKCGINAVTPRFTIDRELGYCEICAEILHLGETKEARRMEFNLSVKKEEVAAPEPGLAVGEEPDAEVDDEPPPESLDD